MDMNTNVISILNKDIVLLINFKTFYSCAKNHVKEIKDIYYYEGVIKGYLDCSRYHEVISLNEYDYLMKLVRRISRKKEVNIKEVK